MFDRPASALPTAIPIGPRPTSATRARDGFFTIPTSLVVPPCHPERSEGSALVFFKALRSRSFVASLLRMTGNATVGYTHRKQVKHAPSSGQNGSSDLPAGGRRLRRRARQSHAGTLRRPSH